MSAETMKGRVELDGTREVLEQLGLQFAAEALTDLITEAVKDDLPVHRFLDKVLAAELSRRDERRVKTSLRLSGLPVSADLDPRNSDGLALPGPGLGCAGSG